MEDQHEDSIPNYGVIKNIWLPGSDFQSLTRNHESTVILRLVIFFRIHFREYPRVSKAPLTRIIIFPLIYDMLDSFIREKED